MTRGRSGKSAANNETPRLRMKRGAALFRDEEQKRFSLNRDTRNTLIAGIAMLVVFVLSVLLVFNLLHPNLSAAWVAQGVARRVRDIVDLF